MEVLNKEKVLELAKRLIEEGKVDKAIVEYRKLLEIDPKDMRIRLRVAELLARLKKLNEAIKEYQEVANNYSEDGFYLKAVTVYKNILRLNPSLIDINYKLAGLYEKMGLNKDSMHQYQILASALEHKGDLEALIDVRKKMVELAPHNVSNRIRLAETYQYEGMEEESLNEYEKLVDEIKKIGKVDQLIELYEKILSYRPNNLEMTRALAGIYYKRGEWKKVLSTLDKKDALIENEADLIQMQADVYGRLNQLETARGKYKIVATLYIDAGELDKALEAYKELLVISPDQEGDVQKLVDEIDPDLFEKVKREADEKRKRLEERLVEDEEEAEPSEGTTEEGPVSTYSDKEMKNRLREADSAFELGKAYRQMGLMDESRPELEKSHEIYRKLKISGCKEEIVDERIVQIDDWLGRKAEIVKRVDKEDTIDLSKKEKEIIKVKKGKEKKKEKEKEKEKEKKKEEPKKKKRDKRMGFV